MNTELIKSARKMRDEMLAEQVNGWPNIVAELIAELEVSRPRESADMGTTAVNPICQKCGTEIIVDDGGMVMSGNRFYHNTCAPSYRPTAEPDSRPADVAGLVELLRHDSKWLASHEMIPAAARASLAADMLRDLAFRKEAWEGCDKDRMELEQALAAKNEQCARDCMGHPIDGHRKWVSLESREAVEQALAAEKAAREKAEAELFASAKYNPTEREGNAIMAEAAAIERAENAEAALDTARAELRRMTEALSEIRTRCQRRGAAFAPILSLIDAALGGSNVQ